MSVNILNKEIKKVYSPQLTFISNLNITKYSEILHFVGLRKPTGPAKIYVT